MKIKEVAKYLRLSPETIGILISKGKIPSTMTAKYFGRDIKKEDLDNYLKELNVSIESER